MKPLEAEQLLGGHAAGILSEAERKALFTAALEDQALFDALADQEVLRELLADPASRAQLLTALAPAKRAVPFWRHPALLGAAASLLVAATAGLAYLRSPQPLPPPLEPPALKEAPAVKDTPTVMATPAAMETPAAKDTPTAKETPAAKPTPPARDIPTARETLAVPATLAREERLQKQKAAPSPAAPTQIVPPPPPAPPAVGLSKPPEAAAAPKVMELKKASQERNEAVQDRGEALRSRPAKFMAPAPAPAASSTAASATAAPTPVTAGVPGGVPGGVIGGVVGGVIGGGARAKKAEAPLKADAQTPGTVRGETVIPPAWNLETLPDGRAQVTVLAPPYAQALLLQRGSAGLRVVKLLKIEGPGGSLFRWRAQFSLGPGDTLDLYLLNIPVANPRKLPEEGPVDGFRVRIHPPANSK